MLAELERRLERGDLELRFHDGRATRAHFACLALTSSVLQNLMDDVLGGHGAPKGNWPDVSGQLSSLKVSLYAGTRASHSWTAVEDGARSVLVSQHTHKWQIDDMRLSCPMRPSHLAG